MDRLAVGLWDKLPAGLGPNTTLFMSSMIGLRGRIVLLFFLPDFYSISFVLFFFADFVIEKKFLDHYGKEAKEDAV